MIACQSTLSLSKKRYAPIVSAQPWHAFGTLAVGSAANRSIKILARFFRRIAQVELSKFCLDPRRWCCRQFVHAKDESKPETRRVYTGRVKSLNVNVFSGRPGGGAHLCITRCLKSRYPPRHFVRVRSRDCFFR